MTAGLFVSVAVGIACGSDAHENAALVAVAVHATSAQSSVAVRAAPVPVRLSGFDPMREWLAEDGLLPVRWNNQQFPWIKEPQDCRAIWQSRLVRDEPGWQRLTLLDSHDDDGAVQAKTCAQCAAGIRSGRFAHTTYEMMEKLFFITADGALSAIVHAAPSARSALSPVDLQSLVHELLPSPVDRDTIACPDTPELAWHIEGNTIHREDESWFEWIEPVVFGDIDCDGWEDIVTLYGGGARQGTMRYYDVRAFTRLATGPLVEITPRMPQCMPSAAERAQQIAGWRSNYGLPTDQPIELRGRCDCGDAEHDMWMTIRASEGILSGAYQCERRADSLRTNGCLADGSGLITEFGIDSAPTAQLHLEWHIDGGALCISGYRCGTGHMETDDFHVEGKVVMKGAQPDTKVR